MKIIHILKTASVGLKTHKGRSFLTILGIVIAISSIILITSIGEGAQNLILNEISGLGAETIVIRPGKEPSGPTDIIDTLFGNSITDRDIKALKRKNNVPGLVDVAPAVFVSGSASYKGETYRPQIFGWSAEFLAKSFNVFPESGRLFDENDIRSNAAAAVIGSKVKKELFGNDNAVGKNIKIKGKNFRVVGVFAKKGQVAFFNIDETVIIPYSTAQKSLLGIDYYNEVITRAKSADIVPQTVRDIEATIRESHGITDPNKDDFFVATQQQAIKQIKTITDSLTVFLASVVAVALVVGGIGVMNIMLVSVTERTREIGLRKALGATKKDILYQFLIEAVILTGIGGIIGIILGDLLGILASFIISKTLASTWVFAFPLSTTFLALGISALVGLVFGLYPAYQAAKKSPIESLRYE